MAVTRCKYYQLTYSVDRAYCRQLALKLQLATAQRKGEIVSIEWNEIDLTTRWWSVPASKAKNGNPNRVYLSDLAMELLTEIKVLSGESKWAFPAPIGDDHITGFILFSNLFILPYIDINNPTNLPLIAILKPFFLLVIISQIFEFSGTIGTFILRAGYETKKPMIINLICRWGIIVPLSYLLSKTLAWGINGIAIAQIIGLAVCTALIFYRWKLMTYNTSNQYTQIETMPN